MFIAKQLSLFWNSYHSVAAKCVCLCVSVSFLFAQTYKCYNIFITFFSWQLHSAILLFLISTVHSVGFFSFCFVFVSSFFANPTFRVSTFYFHTFHSVYFGAHAILSLIVHCIFLSTLSLKHQLYYGEMRRAPFFTYIHQFQWLCDSQTLIHYTQTWLIFNANIYMRFCINSYLFCSF